MRQLTFLGFLSKYVRILSGRDTNSLHVLVGEAEGSNPRLREPLLLYAVFSGKGEFLLRVSRDTTLHEQFSTIIGLYSPEEFMVMLQKSSPLLPDAYHKVWRSYLSASSRPQTDERTKSLLLERIRRLQSEHRITNYRIYSDLALNPGNLNAWLKHGDGAKVSLDTARKVLRYVENRAERAL